MNKITAIPAKFVIGDVAMQLVNNGISFKLNMNKGHLPGDTFGYQWNTTYENSKEDKKALKIGPETKLYWCASYTKRSLLLKILKVKSVIKIADAWKKV